MNNRIESELKRLFGELPAAKSSQGADEEFFKDMREATGECLRKVSEAFQRMLERRKWREYH